jgi:hypothetical protein
MGDMTNSTPAVLMRDYILTRIPSNQLTGWTWFLGKIPSTPDKVICLIDQGGPAAFPHMLTDWPGLQVLVRSQRGGTGYSDSYLMMRKIRDAILGQPGHPPEFVELTSVTERGTIVPLGYDDSDRHTWSCNFQLIIEPGTNAITHRLPL